MGNINTRETEIVIFFPAGDTEFPTCHIWKIRITNRRTREFRGRSWGVLTTSRLALCLGIHWPDTNPPFWCDFIFCFLVWTASVQQKQSDQVSRAPAQKETPRSTIPSSLLTTRVLKPLGLRWCTSIGSDGGPRCPKVTHCWRIFPETRQDHSAPPHRKRHHHPSFAGVADETESQAIDSNGWMLAPYPLLIVSISKKSAVEWRRPPGLAAWPLCYYDEAPFCGVEFL